MLLCWSSSRWRLCVYGIVDGRSDGSALAGRRLGARAAARRSSCSPGLFVVNPNEGRVLQLFGDYVGHRQDARAALGEPVLHEEADLAARAQLRERAAEGQRQRRQPDRDRRGRRLAGRRHRGSGLRGGRLQQLREGAERIGAAQPGDELHLRRARRRADVAARPHRGGRRAPEEGDPGPAVARRRRSDRGAHQPPRLRAGDRARDAAAAAGRARSSPRASASSKARSAWSRWRSRCSRAATSSRSTTSARRRW